MQYAEKTKQKIQEITYKSYHDKFIKPTATPFFGSPKISFSVCTKSLRFFRSQEKKENRKTETMVSLLSRLPFTVSKISMIFTRSDEESRATDFKTHWQKKFIKAIRTEANHWGLVSFKQLRDPPDIWV